MAPAQDLVRETRTGTSANGMEYAVWGDGAPAALFLPGAPSSSLPHGVWHRLAGRQLAPYLRAGYSAWLTTRRRGMPAGHSVADIADDYAGLVDEQLGGRADLVVGTSFGGLVALQLAARRPDAVGLVALVASGSSVSPWCADVDARAAGALRRGDLREAAVVLGEYVAPGERVGPLRRLLAPLLSRVLLPAHDTALSDALVELEAERGCDTRPVLGEVRAPVLVLAGERDRIFPLADVLDAAALLRDCTVLSYPGRGHVGMASASRVPRDVLAFAARRSERRGRAS